MTPTSFEKLEDVSSHADVSKKEEKEDERVPHFRVHFTEEAKYGCHDNHLK